MNSSLAQLAEFLRQIEQQGYERGFADGERMERLNNKNVELRTAASLLLSYRDRNPLNFQLEKADDFLDRMRMALVPDGD